jgi:hypothetical protein
MGSPSDHPDGERERYQRFAASAAELLQLVTALQGTTTPLDLLVENINALLTDAIELAPKTAQPTIRQPTVTLTYELPRRPAHSPAAELTRINNEAARVNTTLAGAVSNAKNAFEALARAEGHPSPALLHTITAALAAIQTCRDSLMQLAHDHKIAVASPRLALDGFLARTMPAASSRSFVSPSAPASSPRVDNEPRQGPRVTDPRRAF